MGWQASRANVAWSEPRESYVLVLDDDQFDRKRIVRWAQKSGLGAITVVEATTLAEFEVHLSVHDFTLVMIDFVLPEGNGFDALTLLAHSKRNADAYTVMVSGQVDETTASQAMAWGCDRYVAKDSLSKMTVSEILRAADHRTLPKRSSEEAQSDSLTARLARRARRRAIERPQFGENPPKKPLILSKPLSSIEIGFASPRDSGFFAEFFEADEFEFDLSPKRS